MPAGAGPEQGFGLETASCTESILLSLPPQADWHHNLTFAPDPREAITQQWLRPGVDWLNVDQQAARLIRPRLRPAARARAKAWAALTPSSRPEWPWCTTRPEQLP